MGIHRSRPGLTYGSQAMAQHLLGLMLAIWSVLPQVAIGSLLALWLTRT